MKGITLRDELIGLAFIAIAIILMVVAYYYDLNSMEEYRHTQCMKQCSFDSMFLKKNCTC